MASSSYNKRDTQPNDTSSLKTKIFVYDPEAAVVDDTGGIVRNPPGGGARPGTAPIGGTALWADYCSIETSNLRQAPSAGRQTAQALKLVIVRFSRVKPYRDGLMIQVNWSGERMIISGTELVGEDFRRYELTCRTVS